MQWRLRKRISDGRRVHCRNNVGLSWSGIIRSYDKEDLTCTGDCAESRQPRFSDVYIYTWVREKGKSVLHFDCMSTENNAAPPFGVPLWGERWEIKWTVADRIVDEGALALSRFRRIRVRAFTMENNICPRIRHPARSSPFFLKFFRRVLDTKDDSTDWLRGTKSLLISLANLWRAIGNWSLH